MSEVLGVKAFSFKKGQLRLFLIFETGLILIFLFLLYLGLPGLAIAVLIAPFQLLLWALLVNDIQRVLVAFMTFLPFSGVSFFPRAYDRYIFFTGTVFLLVFLKMTDYLGAEGLRPKTEEERARSAGSHTPVISLKWVPFLLLGIWTVLSTVNAIRHGWGRGFLLVMTAITIEVLIIAYFLATAPKAIEDVKRLLYLLVGMTVLVVILITFLSPSRDVIWGLGGRMIRLPLTEVNLNTVGFFVGPVAVLALGMAEGESQKRERFLLRVAVVFLVIMLVLTKSRGSWFGFGAAFLYLLIRARSPWLLFLAVVLAIGITGLSIFRGVFLGRLESVSAYDPSLLGRAILWNFAYNIGKANWLFGVGIENFRYVKHFYGFPLPLSRGVDFNSHNIYLEFFVDLGVVGLFAFIWLLAGAFIRYLKVKREWEGWGLSLGLSAALVAYCIHGLADCVLFMPGVFALLGVFIGLSIAIERFAAKYT